MTVWVLSAFLTILSFAGMAAEKEAEATNPPLARAVYAKGRIKVDGALNESDWLAVEESDRVLLGRRTEGPEDPLATECCLLYDERYLYIGARCYQPAALNEREIKREREVLMHDFLAFYFDREGDGHSYLMFAIAPVGAGADLYASSSPEKGMRMDLSYTAAWQVVASPGDKEWLVEARIPLKALGVSVPDHPLVLGFDMSRRLDGKAGEDRWSNPDKGVVRSTRFGRLAIGGAPLTARCGGVEVTSADAGSIVFDIHNPGWNTRTAQARVSVKSASRSAVTSEMVELAPLERKIIRMPVVLADPRAALEISVSQVDPLAVLNRQKIEFTVGGISVWCPQAICRAGQIALPVGYSARTPLPGKVSATVTVYASEGRAKALASQTTVSGGSGTFPLDVSTLKPGRYEIRLDVSAQPRPASCSLVIVPQSVRLGSEWTWNPDRGKAGGAATGTTP